MNNYRDKIWSSSGIKKGNSPVIRLLFDLGCGDILQAKTLINRFYNTKCPDVKLPSSKSKRRKMKITCCQENWKEFKEWVKDNINNNAL